MKFWMQFKANETYKNVPFIFGVTPLILTKNGKRSAFYTLKKNRGLFGNISGIDL